MSVKDEKKCYLERLHRIEDFITQIVHWIFIRLANDGVKISTTTSQPHQLCKKE